MHRLRSFAVLALALAAATLLPLVASASGAGGVTGPAFYVDGVLYRTVGTPTDLSGTGAPAHTFDVIYSLSPSGLQPNVATAAPGDPDFHGGRWEVHRITFDDYATAVALHDANGSGDLDSAAEVRAALNDGTAADWGVVRRFVCTVVRVPGRS
jgi:hypothetical protein